MDITNSLENLDINESNSTNSTSLRKTKAGNSLGKLKLPDVHGFIPIKLDSNATKQFDAYKKNSEKNTGRRSISPKYVSEDKKHLLLGPRKHSEHFGTSKSNLVGSRIRDNDRTIFDLEDYVRNTPVYGHDEKMPKKFNVKRKSHRLGRLSSSTKSLSSSLVSVDKSNSNESDNTDSFSVTEENSSFRSNRNTPLYGHKESPKKFNDRKLSHRQGSISSRSISLSSSLFSVDKLYLNESDSTDCLSVTEKNTSIKPNRKTSLYGHRESPKKFNDRKMSHKQGSLSSKSLSSSQSSVNKSYLNDSDDTDCLSVSNRTSIRANYFNDPHRHENKNKRDQLVKKVIPRRGGLTISYIKDMCRQNNFQLIRALNSQLEEFSNFFDLPLRKDYIIPAIQFVLKLCSVEYELSKKEFLNIILNSTEFVQSISSYIDSIEELSQTVSETERNSKIVITFYKEIAEYIPNKTIVHYNDLLLKTIHTFNKIEGFPKEFIKSVTLCRAILSKKRSLVDKTLINYRNLSVFPTTEDLTEEPALRSNIISGPYDNVEDYIDIQFKLLKEDFVSCFRSGLNQYKTQLKERTKMRNHDIFIYNKAIYKGLSEHINPSKKLTHIFEVEKNYLSKVQWEVSKRFIHGSLLMFSDDNFKTFFIGIFDERDFSGDKTNWSISVVLINKYIKLKKYSEYVMVESKVFFEPYYHVLNVLKSIHPQMFPMEKYLISINTSPKMPCYLTQGASYIISDIEVPINNLNAWPNPENIGLNQSQLEALQAALTRELVVIQGPPGTGKTHLGIKLIDVLLDNKDQWCEGKSSIFIACFRNNAVDQILDALALNKRSVVRLGGRSDSKILKDNTLKNTIGHLRDPIMHQRLADLKSEIINIKMKITELEKVKDFIAERQGILSLETLGIVMAPNHLKYLSGQNTYENWLLGGMEMKGPFNELQDSDDFLNNPIIKKAKKLSLPKEHPFIFLSVRHLLNELQELDFEIENFYLNLSDDGGSSQMDLSPENIALLTQMLTYYNDKLFLLKKVLNRLIMKESKELPVLINSDLDTLTIQERWTLYNYWGKEFLNLCEKKLDILIEEHNIKLLDFLEKKDLNDGENLRRARVDVIGATTTGAARLNKLLTVAKPKIVIIEEAAEVLEAHAIASLTENCEHLILIGDHKQLRPTPASHVSTVKYHLDVSLFERMLKNGMDCFTLSVQHRMRPEISRLVVPQIYPTLSNHPSVEEYPDVKGIRKNLYFLNHSVSEDELKDNDSHQNKFEAFFILALADYLIKQGYNSSNITVLTVYGAQLIFMKSIQKNYPNLEEVEIQVVDNFQGEENDIILLSLVRSNSSTIGFLSKENRVCVALTRAKVGFYIIGNMETLQLNSSVWKQMKRTLEDNSSLGDSLPLKCETHNRITKVKTFEDFKPLQYGGCSYECGMKLDCSHTCTFLCHAVDREHNAYFTCQEKCLKKRNCGIHNCTSKCGNECPPCDVNLPVVLPCGHEGFQICAGDYLPCKVNCSTALSCGHLCPKKCHFENDDHAECSALCHKPNKTCPFNHLCMKKCGDDCGECIFDSLIDLGCGHIAKGICNEVRDIQCEAQVDKELLCGHIKNAPCFKPIDEIECTEEIKVTLPCLHEVSVLCQMEKNDIICDANVMKVLPCGHEANVLCSTPSNEIYCHEKISKILPCGHKHNDAPCSSNLDELICNEEIQKSFKCGHKVKLPCFMIKSESKCPAPCCLLLNCGHECKGTCGQSCPPCKVEIEIKEACGHLRAVPCSSVKGLTRSVDDIGPDNCKIVCHETLPCGHVCKGTCGECMQGRLHIMCNAVCNKELICSHRCANKCWSDFHTCKNNCLNICRHQVCQRKCGEICEKCMEPCDWKCVHKQCSMKCWEICDRTPCLKPCRITMDCGHPCLGYCGEPCPPVCGTCNTNLSIDINTRFIFLEDCGHVLSQEDVEELLLKSTGLIVCPKCNTPVIKTNFFKGHTRRFLSKYSKVKTKALEIHNTRTYIIQDFKKNFKLLNGVLKSKYKGCNSLNKLLQNLVIRTSPILRGKPCNESKLNLKSLLFICFYVTEALKMSKVENLNEDKTSKLLLRINHLATYLLSRSKNISPSEMHLFFKELNRLRLIIDLMQLEQDRYFIYSNAENTELYKMAQAIAFSFKQFSSHEQLNSIKYLQSLKMHISSNYVLMSTEDSNFQKITDFFSKYYPINFHVKNWHKCNNNHIFYLDSHQENTQCPLCSNNKNKSLFFPE